MVWLMLFCTPAHRTGVFFCYVLGSGEPVAAAADLLCSVLNQNVTAWRSAVYHTAAGSEECAVSTSN